MPINSESLNRKLYNLLTVRGYNPKPLDVEGKVTPVPEESAVMKFDFVKDDKNYGQVWISIDGSKTLQVYYGDAVADSPSDKTRDASYDDTWTGLIRHLKNWAQRRQLGFELKNENHLESDMAKRSHTAKKEKISEASTAGKSNSSFIITAKTAEGDTKKYRVKAQSPNMAKEKFTQHHSMAKILDVKEEGVAEGSDYQEPKLGTIKANLMLSKEPTVQVKVFKHNTLRGDSYWVTKEVRTFKTMDQAQAYVDRINKQDVAEGSKRKKKKTSRSLGRYFFPGYGYYGSGESGESGDGGGGESSNRGMAEGQTGVSVKKWAAQVRQEHGADTKFSNDKVHNRVIARKDKEIVGSYDRKANNGTVFSPEQGVSEGYSLKKTNVEKTFDPGDPDEYTQDVNTTYTDYEIINNKTGQVVGTASWTTNDFMGPGALKITMKNGATRWLDIWEREKGNPQTAFNRFVKDPKTAKKYKEQDIKGVAEMDNRTSSGDRREQRANSPEEKAKREKEQQANLKKVSPEMRKKLRLPDPDKEDMAEGTESILARGTEVTVPHRGKMVPGKILRYVAGKGGYSDTYVVDIGEYESLTVPTFNVKTQGMSEGSEEKDPVWNKGTPMPKDYTCHCGIAVHPSVRNPKAIHIPDCPYAKKQDMAEGTEDSTQVLSNIVANEDFDALYDLMSANTEAGKIVQRMYNDVAGEEGLHPDDDFEEILNRVFDHLSQDYGQQDMAEGFGDVVKGIKRSIKGKEHPDVVAAKHLGRALGHYNQGDMELGNKEEKRYIKTRDMHLKAKGVAEGYYGDDRGDYRKTAREANAASRLAKSSKTHAEAARLHNLAATYALSAGQDQSVIRDHQMAAHEHNQAAKKYKKDMAERQESMKQVSEGYYPMGKQGSYSDAVPTTKIIIQHSRKIEEGEQRYRNIAKIFVENTEGERFAVPTIKPGIARVYARHIAEGGTPYDERGKHITSLVEEYSKMAGFVRATKGKQFNESAQQLVNEGLTHYQSLRESLRKMTGHRGYSAYFESWTPSLMEDGEEQTNLNELFVQETLDPRIESVMPILSRLHKKVSEMTEVDSLAEWADVIIDEATIPETTDLEESEDSFNEDEENLDEELDADQKRVGQLGPTEPIGKDGGVGKLVGVSEGNTLASILELAGIKKAQKQ